MAKINKKEKIKSAKNPPPLKIKLKSGDDNSQFAENIINTVREPLIVLDHELKIVTASRSFYSFFKVNPEETIGKLLYDLGNHQWDIPKLRELLETILPEKTTFDNYEVEHDFSTIGKRIMLLNARQIKRALGKEKIILLAIEDITERRHVEKSLSEKSRITEEYLNILLNHAHAPIIIWDPSLAIKRFNREFEILSGYLWTEVQDKKIDMLFPKHKFDATLELINNSLNDEKLKVIEIDILTKDKEVKTVLWNSANVFDKEGKIIVATIAQDITKHKLSEEALRQERDFSRTIVQSSPTFFVAIGSDGKTIMMNDSMLQALGYTLSEVVGMDYLTNFVPVEDRERLSKIFEALLTTNKPTVNENRILTKDGRKIIVEWHGKNILKPNGELNYFIGIGVDLTERKRAEEVLRESQQIIEGIINSIPVRVFWKDKNLVYLGCNTIFALDAGFTDPKEMIGKDDYQMGWSDQAELYRADDRKVIESGKSKLFIEEPQTTPDGKTITLLTSKIPLRSSNGEIVGLLGTYIDITDRKNAESKLRESEERFRKLYEDAKIGLYRTTPDGTILMANKALVKMLGYPSFEMLTTRNLEKDGFKPTYQRKEFLEKIEKDGEVNNFESAWMRLDGSVFFVLESAQAIRDPNNNILYFDGVVEDITERKRAETEITMLAQSLKSINESVSITDLEDKILFVNQSFLKTYGYNKNELIGKHIDIVRSLSNPLEFVKEILPATIRGEWQGELLNKRKDGSEFLVYLSTTVIKDKDNKPLGLIGVASDITKRKQMTDELLKLSRAVEQSPVSIIITDTDGNIQYLNPKVTELTGYKFEEVIGKNPRIFSSGEKPKGEYKDLWDTIVSGQEWRGEFHNKKKNGELYWELVSISPIMNEKGETTHFLAVKEDITKRKLAEKELIKAKERAEESDKLKSEFLAQMSHEIRTPLNAIVGNVEYLNDLFGKKLDPDARDCFDVIDLASKRIIRTVELILNTAELQTSGYKPKFVKIDLTEVLDILYQEHQLSAKQKGLDITYTCKEKGTKVIADEYSTIQIFANLINNAIKYTKKGIVEIRLGNNKTGNIIVEVKDSGIGMSKEFLPRIFEPFTQEEQGYNRSFEGNGLGLALVKNYCNINNVLIEVESEKNVGSTFRIIFNKEAAKV